jgi:large subunit ribosomal protein L10
LTRKEKEKIVLELTEGFKSSDAIVACEYKGLKVIDLETLRQSAREANVKIQVVKNTLATIALKEAGVEGFELKDTNILAWGDDQLNVAKVVSKFAEKNQIFTIKSAYIGGSMEDVAKVEALSKLPSKEELIAMLLQVWKAPIANFTIGLDALRAKKEESA